MGSCSNTGGQTSGQELLVEETGKKRIGRHHLHLDYWCGAGGGATGLDSYNLQQKVLSNIVFLLSRG